MKKRDDSTDLDRAIGQTVSTRRQTSQLALDVAAGALGLTAAKYYACEQGEVPFEAKHLLALADLFECQLRDLMPDNRLLDTMDRDVRYGEAEEVRDLIYFFSGVVSPTLRGFFLKQIEQASVQGERLVEASPAEAPARTVAKKRLRAFQFLGVN